jgi:signal transduction histidine kinase
MQFRSLEARLQIGLGVSLFVLIAAAWWLGHDALHRSTEAYVLSRLKHDGEALLGRLRQAPAGPLAPDFRDGMPIYDQPLSGHYFQILGDGEAVRSRSLWDTDLDVPPIAPGEVLHWHGAGPAGQHLLTRAAGYRIDGQAITVAVAEDMTPLLSVLRGFERLFAALAVGGLILMLLVQRLILRRTFRLLLPAYRDIEALEHGATQRITEQVPSEILPLVRKLNRLLAVYDKRLERSRNAAGNLAHALKAPLNLLMQQLDRTDAALDNEQRQVCRQQVQRVSRLLERELKRARIAGGGSPGSLFDPAEELPVLSGLLGRLYADKGLSIDCDIEVRSPLVADREDMLELFGTLLENACKWAEARVGCRLTPTADGVEVIIADDGPGCGDQDLRLLGTRGLRLDEGVEGYGLGLSIAREIVGLYGGAIAFGRSRALGGFEVRLSLPIRETRCAALSDD